MAYADKHCNCGRSKDYDTMLCSACEDAFADRPEMRIFRSGASREVRRSAAITLLAMSRRRLVRR